MPSRGRRYLQNQGDRMTATGADLDAQSLVDSALEHCVFPLAPADDIAKDGVRMWVKGDGVRVTDAGGRQYLDMMSSHARANSLGYGNAEIADAVAEQLKTMHYAGTVNNMAPPTVQLAEKIAELSPEGLSKVVFVSGGSEAVEIRHQDCKAIPDLRRQAPCLQDHFALECLPRRHHGRPWCHRLAWYASYFRAGRPRLLAHPWSHAVSQSVRHGRRGVLRVLCRVPGEPDPA